MSLVLHDLCSRNSQCITIAPQDECVVVDYVLTPLVYLHWVCTHNMMDATSVRCTQVIHHVCSIHYSILLTTCIFSELSMKILLTPAQIQLPFPILPLLGNNIDTKELKHATPYPVSPIFTLSPTRIGLITTNQMSILIPAFPSHCSLT